MKTPNILAGLAALFFVFAVAPSPATAAESVSIKGILILASNDAGPTDSSLSKVEPTLRRLFKFEGYRQVGRTSTRVDVPGKGQLTFGGDVLAIETTGDGGGTVRARVTWRRGDQTVINTTVRMKPGVPTLLGGPSARGGKGNLIVILEVD
ncbi:MAG: hypothetical protein R3F07_11585 [Opitutaceae bacterium]